MDPRDRHLALVETMGLLFGILAALIVLLVAAPRLSWEFGDASGVRITKFVAVLVVFTTAQGAVFAFDLVWRWRVTKRTGGFLSLLHAPMTVLVVCLSAYLALTCIPAVDVLAHGRAVRWTVTREPEVRATVVLLLVGVLMPVGWFLVATRWAGGQRARALAGMYAVIAAITAVVWLVAVRWVP